MGSPMHLMQKYPGNPTWSYQKDIQPSQLIKVRPGMEAEALKATRFNGADEVAFKHQGDLYIASARDIDFGWLKKKDRETVLNGQPVQIVRLDDEVTSAKEGLKDTFGRMMIGPGSIEVPFAAVGALVGSFYGAVKAALSSKAEQLAQFGEHVTDGPFAR